MRASIYLLLRTLPFIAMAGCGHTPGSGLTAMVDTPVLPYKAPDQDAIADITGVDADDEAAILAGSSSGSGATKPTGGN